jgi:iron-sulfur cluster insertion protein
MSTTVQEKAKNSTATQTAPVSVDQSAIDRVKWLREREGLDKNVKLRVAIVGGGCSGFKYAMGLTDEVFEDDQVFSDAVVIDETSLEIMAGSKISYQDQLTGAQFVIENPNVVSGCGCGSSFSVKGEA